MSAENISLVQSNTPAQYENITPTVIKAMQKTENDVKGKRGADNQDVVINQDLVDKSIKQANESLKSLNRYISREVHEVTHAVMYTLKDSTTNEVIAEFPPKRIQDMVAKMWEIAGLFVDEQA